MGVTTVILADARRGAVTTERERAGLPAGPADVAISGPMQKRLTSPPGLQTLFTTRFANFPNVKPATYGRARFSEGMRCTCDLITRCTLASLVLSASLSTRLSRTPGASGL